MSHQNDWLTDGPPILTVSEVSGAIKEILEGTFPHLRVRGEISNLSRPRSGHLYFSLLEDRQDGAAASRVASAQLPCVMWRSSVARLRFQPESGMTVVMTGRIGVYEPRGTYQLIGDSLEPAGLGELQRLFEELKNRLRDEGLFAPERKRPLPFLPRRIGLITSPSGAAILDFLRILYQRFPAAWVRLVPVRVQGDGAAGEIAAAIDRLQREDDPVDVIVLTRGGGSLEDLWAFNEETVARAIACCQVPLVSAVGHEVDYTIADFVADSRAQTPTHASELVVPDLEELRAAMEQNLRRLAVAVGAVLRRAHDSWQRSRSRRLFEVPEELINDRFKHCDRVFDLLDSAASHRGRIWVDSVLAHAGRLEALSPLRVLSRGYAKLSRLDGRVVLDAGSVEPGELLDAVLARGRLSVRVEGEGKADLAADASSESQAAETK